MKIIYKIIAALLLIAAIISMIKGNRIEALLMFIVSLLADLPNQIEEIMKNINNQ